VYGKVSPKHQEKMAALLTGPITAKASNHENVPAEGDITQS